MEVGEKIKRRLEKADRIKQLMDEVREWVVWCEGKTKDYADVYDIVARDLRHVWEALMVYREGLLLLADNYADIPMKDEDNRRMAWKTLRFGKELLRGRLASLDGDVVMLERVNEVQAAKELVELVNRIRELLR